MDFIGRIIVTIQMALLLLFLVQYVARGMTEEAFMVATIIAVFGFALFFLGGLPDVED